MTCAPPWRAELEALALGDLEPARTHALLEHLERCSPCSETFDDLADLVSGLAAMRRRPARRWTTLAAAASLLFAAFLALHALAARDGTSTAHLAVLDAIPYVPATLRTAEGDAPDPRFEAAMHAYRARDYATARHALEALAADEGPLVLLYLGVCRVQTGALDAARDAFQRAARAGRGMLARRARWLLANVHLALGEGDAAAAVLRELAAEDQEFAIEARRTLRAMGR